jgi:Transposase, Mutator family
MNIVERAKAFVHSLEALAKRTAWDWRRCPKCGQADTIKHGTYTVHPWYLDGRREVVIQRHKCSVCSGSAVGGGKTFTYSEQSPYLVRGSWYAREVHRYSIDLWQHGRSSVRRASEFVRSLLGRQERWLLWRLFESPAEDGDGADDRAKCRFSPSTLDRWLDRAGEVAKGTVKGQLEGAKVSGQVGVDGLWVRLKGTAEGKVKRVVLVLVDSVTGLIYPPVVAEGEEDEAPWKQLFARAQRAGLSRLRGVTSDGASGLLGYLGKTLYFVNHQRCVFHIWRNLGGELAKAAAEGTKDLVGNAAKEAKKAVRRELTSLVHQVLDAKSEADAECALAALRAHRLGSKLALLVEEHLDAALVHLNRYNRGLVRVGPEWLWRDFRLRVSRGRNQGSDARLERAALAWQVYANFTPAQRRSEKKRTYRRAGKSPLEMAGVPPGSLSYLDALAV